MKKSPYDLGFQVGELDRDREKRVFHARFHDSATRHLLEQAHAEVGPFLTEQEIQEAVQGYVDGYLADDDIPPWDLPESNEVA